MFSVLFEVRRIDEPSEPVVVVSLVTVPHEDARVGFRFAFDMETLPVVFVFSVHIFVPEVTFNAVGTFPDVCILRAVVSLDVSDFLLDTQVEIFFV